MCMIQLSIISETGSGDLIGSSTRKLTVFDFWPHTEKLAVCDENSWSARLSFLTVTPFYEPITEVVLLTWLMRG